VELVSLRLRATKKATDLKFSELARGLGDREAPPASARPAYFGKAHGAITTPVIARRDLVARRAGPLIIEEPDSTIVVPPGWSVTKDARENLLLER
jgi:N-methylhydantoinase A